MDWEGIAEKYNQCIAKQLVEDFNAYSEDLYHYTKLVKFKEIISTKYFILTEHANSNYHSEGKWPCKILNDLFQNACNKNTDYEQFKPFWESVFQKLEQLFSDKKIKLFNFSFCAKKDYLCAWRAYADDGSGVSIGFNRQNMIQREGIPPYIGKVYYHDDELKNCIAELISIVHLDLLQTNNNPEMRNKHAEYAASALSPLFSLIKHPGFEEEDEHRLVHKLEEENTTPITYPFNLEDIKEIWIGPSSPPNTENDINLILNELNIHDIPVIRSDIPYRQRI